MAKAVDKVVSECMRSLTHKKLIEKDTSAKFVMDMAGLSVGAQHARAQSNLASNSEPEISSQELEQWNDEIGNNISGA